jgi:hypothetical protein
MDRRNLNTEDASSHECERQTGYTLVEILGVTILMVMVVLMTQGMVRNYKRYSIEEIAVQRLKEISRLENIFRHSSDATVNPEKTYGNFFDLQNAQLIPDSYAQSDEHRHTINAFVPNYRLEFMKNAEENDLEPDAFQYMVVAIPLYNSLGLRTYYMQEDGEVYFQNYLFLQPR